MQQRLSLALINPARLLFLTFVTLAACAAAPSKTDKGAAATPHTSASEREEVIDAMQAELQRSMKQLKFKDYDAPYFIAYQLKDLDSQSVTGRFGSLIDRSDTRNRYVYTEVRVGDYAFDNFANIDNEAYRLQEYSVDKRAPLDTNMLALRGILWQLTDEAYKKALSDFLTKKGGAVYATDEKTDVPSFSKERTQKYRGEVRAAPFDQEKWAKVVERMTARMRKSKVLIDGAMEVSVNHTTRYLVTSEGTDIVDDQMVYSIQIEAVARADDGMPLENGRTFYARTASELPDEATITAEVDEMLTELAALREAPVIDPYTGPAILMPEASGVLFHEAVGHRLEGERQRDAEEGQTFRGRLEDQVIPTFLSVYDDPTLERWDGKQLNGFYKYDDEGVVAQRVALIEAGVLRGFLKSRTPIEDAPKSNGHGRAQGVLKPIARMANLMVAADEKQAVPYDELKKMLMAETKKQGKPFGLIIRDITGGSTNTSGYGYQAFKGASRMIYKVDPDTGKETLVRGAELVGTPLVSINKIVAASKETGIFNGYCGAESGYVPVSTIAPALLTTEIELQRSQTVKERAPLLSPPWSENP
jgi:predicted Zn-dependent protease